MAFLARLGKPGVTVSRKPRVAIITTGANVVEIVEQMEPGQVRNAARYEIVGLVLEAGCDVGRLMHIRDGRIGLERAISESLGSEVIVVALSARDKHEDAVDAVKNIGDVRFAGVTEYSNSPMAFGTVEGRPVFVIPSEAAQESFNALIRPALRKMLGRAETC
jgi:molybdopterin molybdotransferase